MQIDIAPAGTLSWNCAPLAVMRELRARLAAAAAQARAARNARAARRGLAATRPSRRASLSSPRRRAAPRLRRQPAVVRQEVSLACPGYQAVLAQVLEDAIDRVGIAGTVRTRLTVRGGQVTDVAFLSGPKEYTKYVQAAVKRMHCSAGGADEVQVPLDVNFAR